MASIQEKKHTNVVSSYLLTVFIGRTPDGKQIRKTKIWHPPENLTPTKAKRAALKAAEQWEIELKEHKQQDDTGIPTDMEFLKFVNKIWFPIRILGGNFKPETISFYTSQIQLFNNFFTGFTLIQNCP